MKKKIHPSSWLSYAWSLFFFLGPLLVVLWIGLHSSQSDSFISFQYMKELIEDRLFLDIMGYSFGVASITTLLCIAIGYPIATYIVAQNFQKQIILLLLFITPLWLNFLLRTYAWIQILGKNGILNQVLFFFTGRKLELIYTSTATIIGMIYNFLPFMIFSIYYALIRIEDQWIQAAKDLGASPRQIFWKITWPLSFYGIRTGSFLVFIPSMTLFVISDLLGGSKHILIGNLIYQYFFISREWEKGTAATLWLIIFLILFFLSLRILWFLAKYVSRKRRLWQGEGS